MSSAHAADARPFDAELVIYRLEEAGATLLALPGTGWSTRLRGFVTGNCADRGRELWLDHEDASVRRFRRPRGSPAWTRRWRGSR